MRITQQRNINEICEGIFSQSNEKKFSYIILQFASAYLVSVWKFDNNDHSVQTE